MAEQYAKIGVPLNAKVVEDLRNIAKQLKISEPF
jgi:hypothetical protein